MPDKLLIKTLMLLSVLVEVGFITCAGLYDINDPVFVLSYITTGFPITGAAFALVVLTPNTREDKRYRSTRLAACSVPFVATCCFRTPPALWICLSSLVLALVSSWFLVLRYAGTKF